jgi:hypothetical protein
MMSLEEISCSFVVEKFSVENGRELEKVTEDYPIIRQVSPSLMNIAKGTGWCFLASYHVYIDLLVSLHELVTI